MKKIKRIFILLSVLLFSAFLLSCSKKEEESTSVSAEEASGLEGVITNYFQQIEAQDDEQLEESINSAYKAKEELFYNALSNYKNAKKDLGEFQEIEKVDVKKEGDTYVVDLHAKYAKRELIFHAALHDDYSGFSELSFNPVYSLSEKLFAAFQNMIVGMGTVFAVLIFIAWIISLFAHLHRWEVRQAEKKKERDGKSSSVASSPAVVSPEKPAVPVLEKEEGISEELLSVILMAAVKAYEEDFAKKNPYSDARTLENGLFVRSIKRRK
ncbi:hypothetical protein HMPREF9624_00505 [Oribacterium asaccharolyticum ACB7]|uniref:Oxaloacetate decarboxylase gamma chain n=1 Tax=Oribacterium asaccharolyticum ACB7 TaxID=796944 RepID=G9WTZ5_9FIRM|nr:OadG family protein [Oribacterium asaccharolyticum]EHL12198.1 hypothetical protein HMPREF9624_00505 [Oribacterium asaccharolyticum ACB7]